MVYYCQEAPYNGINGEEVMHIKSHRIMSTLKHTPSLGIYIYSVSSMHCPNASKHPLYSAVVNWINTYIHYCMR